VRFSTFLNPAGTANAESSTESEEKPLISVVASINEPDCRCPAAVETAARWTTGRPAWLLLPAKPEFSA